MTPEAERTSVRGVVERQQPSANDRFKRGFPGVLAGGLVLATLAHLALFELFPSMRVADVGLRGDVVEAVELPPAVEVPPPPERVARPATPRVSADGSCSGCT